MKSQGSFGWRWGSGCQKESPRVSFLDEACWRPLHTGSYLKKYKTVSEPSTIEDMGYLGVGWVNQWISNISSTAPPPSTWSPWYQHTLGWQWSCLLTRLSTWPGEDLAPLCLWTGMWLGYWGEGQLEPVRDPPHSLCPFVTDSWCDVYFHAADTAEQSPDHWFM